jgi:radical SAM superfamily enzyme YgiQ (UPF0313 family)
MRFKRVLLIFPNYSESYYVYPTQPATGLGYIAEALKCQEIEYDVIDIGLGYSVKDLFKKIDFFHPDLIGMSMMTFRYRQNYQVLSLIKDAYPSIDIMVGGSHISVMREDVLKNCSAVDYGVVLEGEETIVELCNGKELSQIKGLIYRNHNRVIYNGDRPFIDDLDSVPFPTYEKYELSRYGSRTISIVSSRGCPYACIYCPVGSAIGRKFRVRTPKHVVDELAYWYERGYRRFGFVDDNFTLIKDRVYQICDEIEKRGLKGLDLQCGNGVRADQIDRKLLERMKEVGFSYIAFGVEAGNNKILANLKKHEDIKTMEKAIKDACELGYRVGLFFLVGTPGETWEDVKDSIALALKYPVFDASFYNIIPYPKTQLYDWLAEKQYFIVPPEEYLSDISSWDNKPVYVTPSMSLKERKEALKYTKSVRRKIRLRYGYKKHDLIGLLATYVYISEIGRRCLSVSRPLQSLKESLSSIMFKN